MEVRHVSCPPAVGSKQNVCTLSEYLIHKKRGEKKMVLLRAACVLAATLCCTTAVSLPEHIEFDSAAGYKVRLTDGSTTEITEELLQHTLAQMERVAAQHERDGRPQQEEENAAVVLDNGSGMIKAGFAGEKAPRAVSPTVGAQTKDGYVTGAKALLQGSIVQINRPVTSGFVTSWDDMIKVWSGVMKDELSVAPEDHGIILTDPPMDARENREKMTQTFFETFHAPRFHVANSAVLALYASGRTTGVVCEIGHDMTSVVAVHKGRVVLESAMHLDVAGEAITSFLEKLLAEKKGSVAGGHAAVNAMKEAVGEVMSFETAQILSKGGAVEDKPVKYELADGEVVVVGAERFLAPEALFKPNLLGLEQDGIHTTVYNSIMRCDEGLRTELYGNVVMSGGSTMFNGIPERLQKELALLAPDSMTIKIVAPPERQYSVWLGGSILSSLSTFEEMWITKDEYDESGPGIVHRKCT